MKTLVLGSKGQLGKALAETVPGSAEYIGLDLPDLDITSAGAIFELCREEQPVVIINAAAYTAVDKAESEIDVATAVNVEGARNVAAAARDIGARLIHISTDFVFDGTGSTPYSADAETNPLSVYGRTKRDGERAVLDASPDTATVIRTAWLYSKTGSNFVKTMLRLMQERDELSVVADQFGTPTFARDLATWTQRILYSAVDGRSAERLGIFHLGNEGVTTWHGFASAILSHAGYAQVDVVPIDTQLSSAFYALQPL